MKKILLTGFDAFGKEEINPAQKVIQSLEGWQIGEYEVHICKVPTVYKKSIMKVTDYISRINPDIVINIGQAGGRSDICLERVAINIDDFRIEDNEGNQPIDKPINLDGENAYFSNLPIKSVVKKLRENGIPAEVSNSAGTFVCNHLMYGVLDYIYQNELDVLAGFIHVPFLPKQVVNKRKKPSMSIETIIKGLKLAIKSIINNLDEDIKITGGQIH